MKVKMLIGAFLAVTALDAAVVEQVLVRQQWPWSTDIKVEYRISGVTSPVDIAVEAYNGGMKLDSPDLESSITGRRFGISGDCTGSFIIDPVKAFGGKMDALGNFRVKLSLVDTTANLDEELYRIYCLTNGVCTSVTRGELLNGKYGSVETDFSRIGDGFNTALEDVVIWTGVTNDVKYKTTHLVMRKIPAMNKTFRMGTLDDDEAAAVKVDPYWVKLTENYFIGIYPVTVEQHRLINGGAVSEDGVYGDDDTYPFNSAVVFQLRGSRAASQTSGEKTGEPINWPTNSYVHDVVAAYPLGKLRAAFNVDFDLPSEAQWEFACRAGTETGLNSGKTLTAANAEEVGRITGRGEVGTRKPNAFGLYDMHGNVAEQTPNIYSNYDQTDKGATADDPRIDPLGGTSETGANALKGGKGDGEFSAYYYKYVNSGTRSSDISWWSASRTGCGYRMVIPADGAEWKQ